MTVVVFDAHHQQTRRQLVWAVMSLPHVRRVVLQTTLDCQIPLIHHENLHTEIHASIAVTWSKFITCMQHGVA